MSQSKAKFLLIAFKTSKPIILILLPLLVISFLLGFLYSATEPLMYLFPSSGEEYSFQILEGVILVSITVVSAFLIVLAIRKNLVRLKNKAGVKWRSLLKKPKMR